MEILRGRTRISDHMLYRAIDKDIVEKRVQEDLAYSLAKAIMAKENFRTIIMKREEQYNPFPSETIFEAEIFVLTREEVKEYRELQELKRMLKQVTVK
jgi:hypothetical protein